MALSLFKTFKFLALPRGWGSLLFNIFYSSCTQRKEDKRSIIELAKLGEADAIRSRLLRKPESVHEVDEEKGRTALIWAADNGRKDAVAVLVEYHSDVNAQSSTGTQLSFVPAIKVTQK